MCTRTSEENSFRVKLSVPSDDTTLLATRLMRRHVADTRRGRHLESSSTVECETVAE